MAWRVCTRSSFSVSGPLGIRIYAGVPIVTSDGRRIGAVNVLDTRARRCTEPELASLTDLSALAMDQLNLQLATSTAADYAETLQRSLLPPSSLPDVPGLSLAANYHPAANATGRQACVRADR